MSKWPTPRCHLNSFTFIRLTNTYLFMSESSHRNVGVRVSSDPTHIIEKQLISETSLSESIKEVHSAASLSHGGDIMR